MRAFVVRGRSMEPTLRDGDVVIVRALTRDVTLGDVVVYRHPVHRFGVVHRIVSWAGGDGWIARGDAAASVDPDSVGPIDIIGRVWFVIPKVGRWTSGLVRKTGTEGRTKNAACGSKSDNGVL
jgi:signal peptidase I